MKTQSDSRAHVINQNTVSCLNARVGALDACRI